MNLPLDFWKCVCGGLNPPAKKICPKCGHDRSSRQTFADVPGCTEEDKLHEEVEKYCRDHRWAYVHARMDRKTTCNRGVADFIIFPPSPHFIILELKKEDGKQTPDQLAWQCVLENQGHVYYIARSFEEFLSILRDKGL